MQALAERPFRRPTRQAGLDYARSCRFGGSSGENHVFD